MSLGVGIFLAEKGSMKWLVLFLLGASGAQASDARMQTEELSVQAELTWRGVESRLQRDLDDKLLIRAHQLCTAALNVSEASISDREIEVKTLYCPQGKDCVESQEDAIREMSYEMPIYDALENKTHSQDRIVIVRKTGVMRFLCEERASRIRSQIGDGFHRQITSPVR